MEKINNSQEAKKLFTVDQALLQKIVGAIIEYKQCEKQDVFALNLNVKSFIPIINFDLGETEFNLNSPSGFAYVESKNNPEINFVFKQENDTFQVVSRDEIKKVSTQLKKLTPGLAQLNSPIHPENLKLMNDLMDTLKAWTHISAEEVIEKAIEQKQKILRVLDKTEINFDDVSVQEKEKFQAIQKLNDNALLKNFSLNILKDEKYPIIPSLLTFQCFVPLNTTEAITGYFHIIDNTNQYIIKKAKDGLHLSGINDVKNELVKMDDKDNSPYVQVLKQFIANHQSIENSFNLLLSEEQKERKTAIWSKLKSSKMLAQADAHSDQTTASNSFYLAKNFRTGEMKGFIQHNGAAQGEIVEMPFDEFVNIINEWANSGYKSVIGMRDLINAQTEKNSLESKIKAFRSSEVNVETNNENKQKI